MRVKQTRGYSSTSSTRAGEGSNPSSHNRAKERITPFDCFNLQMAESRAHVAQGRPHTQATGPPTHGRARGGGDPDKEPSGSSGDEGTREYPQSRTDTGSSRSNQHRDSHVDYADSVVHTGPARNTLDQDYAHCLTSARPQQPPQSVGLTLAPNHA